MTLTDWQSIGAAVWSRSLTCITVVQYNKTVDFVSRDYLLRVVYFYYYSQDKLSIIVILHIAQHSSFPEVQMTKSVSLKVAICHHSSMTKNLRIHRFQLESGAKPQPPMCFLHSNNKFCHSKRFIQKKCVVLNVPIFGPPRGHLPPCPQATPLLLGVVTFCIRFILSASISRKQVCNEKSCLDTLEFAFQNSLSVRFRSHIKIK